MKIGPNPERERVRVRVAREAIGNDVQLFVDANGAYRPKEAIDLAQELAEQRVSWFEEPVSSDDLAGLHQVREHVPAGMAIAAGEYGYDLTYFERMLEADAVDVLQADVTRCGGITRAVAGRRTCAAPAPGRCRCTARRRCTQMRVPPLRPWCTWSTSMTTCGSRSCCSMASRGRAMAYWRRTSHDRGSALSFAGRTRSATPRELALIPRRRARARSARAYGPWSRARGR